MLVVTFQVAGRKNCAVINGEPFVYARTRRGSFVLGVRCPHRGGPLHLARLAPDGKHLICPWHGRATSVTRALAAGLPAVRQGDRVTVVFPHPPAANWRLEHRPLSADLCS